MATRTDSESFGAFFRRYTNTWMHAVSTAGLTAFGLLTFVHRGFVVLALTCYIVPPVVLYLTRSRCDVGVDAPPSPTDAALSDLDSDEPAPASDSPESEPSPANESAPAVDPSREKDASAGTAADEAATGRDGTRATATESDRDPSRAPNSNADPTPAPKTADEPDPEPRWRSIDVPATATLRDAAIADASALAVGDDGIVLERDGEWRVRLGDGPAAGGRALRGVDATDDGAVAWVAGDGGAVGRLEIGSGKHADYSAPGDRTDNLTGLAVAGAAGDETILLIDGSGGVCRGRYRDGDLGWADPVTPGSGSSLSGVTLVDTSAGYCCDTNDGVFATDDGGRTFEPIGVESADGTLTDITAGGRDECHVCTDAGVVHRFDGSVWTPERACESALTGIARRGDRLVVCAADGAVYERAESAADWERSDVPPRARLEAVAAGDDLSVAVGVEGAALEYR
ncbi:hypothetical protein ACNS7O_00660 [Haloferacaceae archaeon DSL9]